MIPHAYIHPLIFLNAFLTKRNTLKAELPSKDNMCIHIICVNSQKRLTGMSEGM